MKIIKKLIAAQIINICFLPVMGQQVIKPLTIGEQVPGFKVTSLVNYPEQELKLSDFKNKLLILDFWGTHCSSCILAMPGDAALQKKYGDQMLILPVSTEKREIIVHFFKTNNYLKKYMIPSAAGDTLLEKLFPHRFWGINIWIFNGRYIASTTLEEVNEANIKAVLNGKAPSWETVTDDISHFDYKTPLFARSVKAGMRASLPVYSTTITGHIDGLINSAGYTADTAGKIKRFYKINMPLLNFYGAVLHSGLVYEANRRIMHVKDSAKFIYDKRYGTGQDWEKENTYTYEALVPITISNKMMDQKQKQDLDAFFNLTTSIEPRDVDCLVLKLKGQTGIKRSVYAKKSISFNTDSSKTYFHRSTIKDLVYTMGHAGRLPPLFDETGYAGYIDLDLHVYPVSLAQWKAELAPYGLELVEEKRRIDMFILTENHP